MMTWEDYKDQVTDDALDYIEENAPSCRDWEEMREWFFVSDQVTGNGSGTYTFSRAQAAENAAGIVFDCDAQQAFEWAGYDHMPVEQGPEALDVIARCVAMGEVNDTLESAYYDAISDLAEA